MLEPWRPLRDGQSQHGPLDRQSSILYILSYT